MTTLHPFSTARESILPLWSSTAQSRRSQPDATVLDLFVLLHGMLFTNIQLDDFYPTLSRFLERLEIEGAEERDWIMMAVVNVCHLGIWPTQWRLAQDRWRELRIGDRSEWLQSEMLSHSLRKTQRRSGWTSTTMVQNLSLCQRRPP